MFCIFFIYNKILYINVFIFYIYLNIYIFTLFIVYIFFISIIFICNILRYVIKRGTVTCSLEFFPDWVFLF